MLAEHIHAGVQAHGLDPSLYGVRAHDHSTTFRWPEIGTAPDGAVVKFGVLEGLLHRYPNGQNNPHGFAAAPEFWRFFLDHPLP